MMKNCRTKPNYRRRNKPMKNRNPDTLFFSRDSLDNFCTALKFIEKDDLYRGMRIEFSELNKCFKEPKLKNYQKLIDEDDKLKNLEEKIETDEKELFGMSTDLAAGEKNINELNRKLIEYQGNKLSESKIKKEAFRFIITSILYEGIEGSRAVKIVRLKKSKEEISSKEYQKKFLELTSNPSDFFCQKFPKLDRKTMQNLGIECLKVAEKISEKYLKQEKEKQAKEKKYDFGIYG